MFRVAVHYNACICGQGPYCGYQCAARAKAVHFSSDERSEADTAFDT